jgi:hypothetical protein
MNKIIKHYPMTGRLIVTRGYINLFSKLLEVAILHVIIKNAYINIVNKMSISVFSL